MGCSSCKGIINKISNIVEGNVNLLFDTDKGNELADKRMPICLSCDKKKEFVKIGDVQYYTCSLCSCPIDSKVRAENEVCPLNKW